MALAASFAVVALSLAFVGVFGLVSYAVSRRRYEFGVRLALGASSSHILRLVLHEGLVLVMIGLVFIIHTPPWRFFGLFGATIFYLFEVVIVVSIQAYIFAALSAIYIGSAIEPDH